MTRLGVVSDSHGAAFRTRQFAETAQRERFDAVIHLGDGMAEAKQLKASLPMPVYYVAGNCDFDMEAPRELVLDFDGVKLLALHGHVFPSIRYDLSRLSYYAEEKGVALALYGHTHRPDVEWAGSVLLVNPGALKDGRYAVVTIEDGNIIPRLMEL